MGYDIFMVQYALNRLEKIINNTGTGQPSLEDEVALKYDTWDNIVMIDGGLHGYVDTSMCADVPELCYKVLGTVLRMRKENAA